MNYVGVDIVQAMVVGNQISFGNESCQFSRPWYFVNSRSIVPEPQVLPCLDMPVIYLFLPTLNHAFCARLPILLSWHDCLCLRTLKTELSYF